jgi:hypothetical protein
MNMKRTLTYFATIALVAASIAGAATSADAARAHKNYNAFVGTYGSVDAPATISGRSAQHPAGSHWSDNNNLNPDFQLGGSY